MVAHEEILSPKRELCAVVKNKNATPLTGGAAERPTVPVVLASLRWYYPGQVLRVVRLGGLSAVWLP